MGRNAKDKRASLKETAVVLIIMLATLGVIIATKGRAVSFINLIQFVIWRVFMSLLVLVVAVILLKKAIEKMKNKKEDFHMKADEEVPLNCMEMNEKIYGIEGNLAEGTSDRAGAAITMMASVFLFAFSAFFFLQGLDKYGYMDTERIVTMLFKILLIIVGAGMIVLSLQSCRVDDRLFVRLKELSQKEGTVHMVKAGKRREVVLWVEYQVGDISFLHHCVVHMQKRKIPALGDKMTVFYCWKTKRAMIKAEYNQCIKYVIIGASFIIVPLAIPLLKIAFEYVIM